MPGGGGPAVAGVLLGLPVGGGSQRGQGGGVPWGGGPAWAPPAFFCGFPWPGLWRDLCLSAKSITVVGMRAREATCQFCTREA